MRDALLGLPSQTQMTLYRDEGVVLRTQKLGEADRIITILTRRNGRVRAVAKGVRRTRSKFGATVEPFSHVDLQLYVGRSLDIVNQAESLMSYGDSLASDYPRYTAGTAVLETAERLTAEEKEPALRLFLLVVGALRALVEGEKDPSLVLDAFLLRAMSVAGYAPALEECAGCGASGPHRAFSVPAGGTVCATCRPPGAARRPSPRGACRWASAAEAAPCAPASPPAAARGCCASCRSACRAGCRRWAAAAGSRASS